MAPFPDEDSLRTWYGDVDRGYRGFEGVRRVFEGFPTYVTRDDHEIGDGWPRRKCGLPF